MKKVNKHSLTWKVLKGLYSPGRALSRIIGQIPFAPFWLKCALDAFKKPYYAYGVVQAALQAQALGIREISLIEFGVGKGAGILELESLGTAVTRNLDVKVKIFGFDLGTGLPNPVDYRDCPYIWKSGFFKMNMPVLNEKLEYATLILGDVKDKARTFFDDYSPPPIGFISFDLDFYTSTVAAFHILKTPSLERFLPRTFCYFDDIVGPDEALHSEFTGELLAISEFNDGNSDRKLARINGLKHKRIAPCFWEEQMYVLHLFEHPHYSTFISSNYYD
jgi:hypothetical protein